METRNQSLQDKLSQAQKVIDEKIAQLPGSMALKKAKETFESDKATQEEKHTYTLGQTSLQQYPLVNMGDKITKPLLDQPTPFERPPTSVMPKEGKSQTLCGSLDPLTKRGCGEARAAKKASEEGTFHIYCRCLANEENRRRTQKNTELQQAHSKEIDEAKTLYQQQIQQLQNAYETNEKKLTEEKTYADTVSKYNKIKGKMVRLTAILEKDSFSFTEAEMNSILTMHQPPVLSVYEIKEGHQDGISPVKPSAPPAPLFMPLPFDNTGEGKIERREGEEHEAEPGEAPPPFASSSSELSSKSKILQLPVPIMHSSSTSEDEENDETSDIKETNDRINIEIILRVLLKQAYRLHQDTSCRSYFLSDGTDKAFAIIEALAELLTDIEHQSPNIILEQLKKACTQAQLSLSTEGDQSLHENSLYTALNKKRFGFFTPSSAEAMNNLINPPKEKKLTEILAGRFSWGITLK